MANHLRTLHVGGARRLLTAALALTLGAVSQSAPAAEAEAEAGNGEYTWSAELVSLDEGAGRATLRSMIEYHADKSGLEDFDEGDRVTLIWTGMSWGAGISSVSGDQAPSAPNGLTLPAEFVATERDGRYLVFRVPVPDASVARLRDLEPGDWVTGVSPRNASDRSRAVTSLHPYGEVN